MKQSHAIPLALLVATVVLMMTIGPARAGDVPLMTVDDLKAMLDNPDLVILDVRKGKDWSSSEFKIKGATYVDTKAYDTWSDSYAKDQKIVLYCA